MKILVIDIGGSHIKVLATGRRIRVQIPSGPQMTPRKMVAAVKAATEGWKYEAISIGYPGFVFEGRPITNPYNLGSGWVGFDFEKAFRCPVKLLNDAAMQALGGYEGGRMLFLGLGTGLGAALILDHVLQPLELAHMHYRKHRSYEDVLGLAGLKRAGKKEWRHEVRKVALELKEALRVEDVVLGGGNARLLKKVPVGMRLGSNDNAFLGGYSLWSAPKMSIPKMSAPQKSREGRS